MQLSLQFPLNKSRIRLIDHPEIVPVALIVVATKLCFPFSNDYPSILGQGTGSRLSLNWEEWTRAVSKPIEDGKQAEKLPSFDDLTPDRLATMTDEQLDAFYAHVSSLVDKPSKHSGHPE